MKKNIHPSYAPIQATCSCGNVITVRSTVGRELHLDTCGKCHPAFTGQQSQQRVTSRNLEKFNKRYGNLTSNKQAS